MRYVPSALAALVAAAGCLAPALQPATMAGVPPVEVPVSFDGLDVPNAKEILDANGTRTFLIEGVTGDAPGVGALVRSGPEPSFGYEDFEVDGRVGFAEVNMTVGGGETYLLGFRVLDEERALQCGGEFGSPCIAPVAADMPETVWTIEVRPVLGAVPPGSPYTLTLVFHPRSHIPETDPLEGIDTSIAFRAVDTGFGGTESNVGVLSDGTIFATMDAGTIRSTDDGASWEYVGPVAEDVSLDPMLRVDPWTDRVYVDHLYVACSRLWWSDDAGETWLHNPAACGLPVDDHQKLATGPSPLPGAPFPALYYSFSGFYGGVFVSRSYDGGVTFLPAQVTPTTPEQLLLGAGPDPRNTGAIEADRDGNVYVPMYMCDEGGGVGVGVSNDYGATFSFVLVDEEDAPCDDVDPGVGIDADGVAYLAYWRPSGVKYAYSTDQGATWSKPVTVSPSNLRSFVHADVVAGDAGKLAIAYRATPDSREGVTASDVPGYSAWRMYVSFVENGTGEPTIRTALTHAPDDPVQRGSICMGGVGCQGGRNLLDFIDIAVTPDGRVVVAYADGCDGPCPRPSDSNADLGIVAILEDGPRLFADGAPWAGAASRLSPRPVSSDVQALH